MRRFVCCLLLPAVVIVGVITIGADKAEARRWIRRAPARAVVSAPAPVIVSPRPYYYRHYDPYWRSRANVYAPGVRVHVGPRGYGGTVITPRVRVAW